MLDYLAAEDALTVVQPCGMMGREFGDGGQCGSLWAKDMRFSQHV